MIIATAWVAIKFFWPSLPYDVADYTHPLAVGLITDLVILLGILAIWACDAIGMAMRRPPRQFQPQGYVPQQFPPPNYAPQTPPPSYPAPEIPPQSTYQPKHSRPAPPTL
ncbi:hypothetical protein GOEFS_075_00470 [Gordonia effusa NBRC 100432]|uniref:Uncharacterized protein n=1 Tax=Gordonia effusa NBRC 100432 TaxID=1077974 RepID=H0R221_9ACTN|nr:hypothetical protein [Gordonia effusa]GAB19126.1 hypothetical protein GOEFS_075_00470 [Gordonia effusa NBRC 100432]